ncbi:uncharacterized protein MKK02DRAFT_37736 [Dioszegia hungarica]|uniref:Uncharacterized protein n=1 Tax=Dioszegia hungarica TaxID=4972 RepID=A0AA38H5F6_9TREE|nr:uncharacterized protein MKK02DRAFT_37736 [Dioszegia hungarica]KAI9634862.1 hypothetical protein MKK02DRAFT_37736 [Dioszegia hungarica]
MISPLTLLTVLVGLIPLLANAGKTVSIWSSGTRPEDLVKFTVENARWEGSLEIAEGYESTDNASNGRWWLKTWKDGQASSAANRQPVEVRFTADLGSKLQLGIVNSCYLDGNST